MVSYELYKVLHISFVFFTLTLSASMLLGNLDAKWPKIIGGISSFLILVTGMGLIARLGFKHNESFPVWLLVKMGLWLFLSIAGPVFAKRLVGRSRLVGFGVILTVAIAAVVFAIFKF